MASRWNRFAVLLAGTIGGFLSAAIVMQLSAAPPIMFSAGEALSSAVLNDLFAALTKNAEPITEADLLGTWSCDSYVDTTYNVPTPPGWTRTFLFSDVEQFLLQNGRITFSQGQDGSFSLSTTAPNPFYPVGYPSFGYVDPPGAWTTPYVVRLNRLNAKATLAKVYPYTPGAPTFSVPMTWDIARLSSSHIRLDWIHGGPGKWLDLNRIDPPPAPDTPDTISAVHADPFVIVGWKHTGNGTAKFKVMRKDSLSGDFVQVGETDAAGRTFSNMVVVPGTYWYRIKAVNGASESIASSACRVVVQ